MRTLEQIADMAERKGLILEYIERADKPYRISLNNMRFVASYKSRANMEDYIERYQR